MPSYYNLKQSELYLPTGYFNAPFVFNTKYNFNFIIGGRGTGKTYGCLKECINRELSVTILRRRCTITDMLLQPQMNPYKALNEDLGLDIQPKKETKDIGVFSDSEREYSNIAAISTLFKFRGAGIKVPQIILYDEFIRETTERPLKNEYSAFMNGYETMVRNDELKGAQPPKTIFLGNSNTLDSDLLLELGLIPVIEKMVNKGYNYFTDTRRSLCIVLLKDSPIAKKKKQTSLYRLTEGSNFYEMAIKNIFSDSGDPRIKSLNLRGFKPVLTVNGICLYKKDCEVYASTHISGSPENVSTIRARHIMGNFVKLAAFTDNLFFETYACKKVCKETFKLDIDL